MTHSGFMTFEEVEVCVQRTYAYTLLASVRVRANIVWIAVATFLVSVKLRALIKTFRNSQIERLSKEEADSIIPMLSQTHSLLVRLEKRLTQRLSEWPFRYVMSRALESMTEATEEVYDILEDLALLHDQEFNGLVSDAIRGLNRLEAVRH